MKHSFINNVETEIPKETLKAINDWNNKFDSIMNSGKGGTFTLNPQESFFGKFYVSELLVDDKIGTTEIKLIEKGCHSQKFSFSFPFELSNHLLSYLSGSRLLTDCLENYSFIPDVTAYCSGGYVFSNKYFIADASWAKISRMLGKNSNGVDGISVLEPRIKNDILNLLGQYGKLAKEKNNSELGFFSAETKSPITFMEPTKPVQNFNP